MKKILGLAGKHKHVYDVTDEQFKWLSINQGYTVTGVVTKENVDGFAGDGFLYRGGLFTPRIVNNLVYMEDGLLGVTRIRTLANAPNPPELRDVSGEVGRGDISKIPNATPLFCVPPEDWANTIRHLRRVGYNSTIDESIFHSPIIVLFRGPLPDPSRR